MNLQHEVTTLKAREKFAIAHAMGGTFPKITEVGWGDGGADSEGNLIFPTDSATIVPGEFVRKPIDGVTTNGLKTTFVLTLLGTDTNAVGKNLSACGLYDSEGDLIAVACFSIKNINANSRIEIEWTETF